MLLFCLRELDFSLRLCYNSINGGVSILLKLDSIFHILFFKYKDIPVSWGISERINFLSLLNYYDDGCIEFNTNIGVESTDLIYGSEDLYTKSQLEVLRALFKRDDLDIKVEVV